MFFDHKFIILISFQGIVISNHVFFFMRTPMGLARGPGRPRNMSYLGQTCKFFIKKFAKWIFAYKSTPDGLPDFENLYPGVVGHAESDFDGARAPK